MTKPMTSWVGENLNLYGRALTLSNNVWVRGHTFSRVLKGSFSLTLVMHSTSRNSTLDSFSRVHVHIVHILDSLFFIPFVKPTSHQLSSYIFQMDPSSCFYIGYVDGASHHSRNLASTAWALFTPMHTLIHSSGVCVGSATNNQVEYDVVIGLLADALDHHICHLHVCLDSQLLIMQLNDIYHVHNPILFRKYL
jgi:hypothetical protein